MGALAQDSAANNFIIKTGLSPLPQHCILPRDSTGHSEWRSCSCWENLVGAPGPIDFFHLEDAGWGSTESCAMSNRILGSQDLSLQLRFNSWPLCAPKRVSPLPLSLRIKQGFSLVIRRAQARFLQTLRLVVRRLGPRLTPHVVADPQLNHLGMMNNERTWSLGGC